MTPVRCRSSTMKAGSWAYGKASWCLTLFTFACAGKRCFRFPRQSAGLSPGPKSASFRSVSGLPIRLRTRFAGLWVCSPRSE